LKFEINTHVFSGTTLYTKNKIKTYYQISSSVNGAHERDRRKNRESIEKPVQESENKAV